MSVTIRKRKNEDGTTSIVLDIYHQGKRKIEFLKDCKLDKVKNQFDRQTNKERLELAQRIRNKRALELDSSENGIAPLFKTKINFIDYFEKFISTYGKKDIRVLSACLSKFKNFLIEEDIKTITTKEVDENLVLNFKEYLESTLNGTSPTTYFKRFKKVLKQGQRDKVFTYNPAQDVSIKENQGISKDILTFKEIQLLFRADCPNNEVKRAFLFSCLTGLRFCDIVTLKWDNINNNVLKVVQQKTKSQVSINLNDDSLNLINEVEKKDEFVFSLPSHTACLKNLKTWCKNAEINKKITWHCARHSFATNIIFYGSDINSASSLLGHTSFKHTQKYVRVVESLKEKAVQNLPSLNLIH
jgi:site-specific recombinase XerD